jgi:hypothetical protein
MAEISLIHCNPRLGDGNLRSYIKGGNLTRGGLLHPRIAAAKSHIFASPWIPSPSPTPACIQWFILPHTFVPSYVNMVFDAISYNPLIYVMFV